MGMWIGRNRKARVTYGFDEIALVPGEITINPAEVDTRFQIPRKDGSAIQLAIPIIASAMDGVTDVKFCIEMGKLGGLGVINLEGIQTRYDDPAEVLEKITKADKDEVTDAVSERIEHLPPGTGPAGHHRDRTIDVVQQPCDHDHESSDQQQVTTGPSGQQAARPYQHAEPRHHVRRHTCRGKRFRHDIGAGQPATHERAAPRVVPPVQTLPAVEVRLAVHGQRRCARSSCS